VNEKILEIERGRTRSHSAGNLLWKSRWTYLKTGHVMMNSGYYTWKRATEALLCFRKQENSVLHKTYMISCLS